MDLIALLSRSVVIPLVMAKNRSRQPAYAREYRRTQFWSAERLAELQLERLRRVVSHALRNSAFYRRWLGEAGLGDADEIRSLDDLRLLPMLSKDALRDNWDEVVVRDPNGPPPTEKRTSGSTGVPLRVLVDEGAMQHKAALTARHNGWAGYRPGDRVAYVWGDVKPPTTLRGKLRGTLLDRAEVLDSQKLDEGRMERFTEALRRRRIRTLVGQAQVLCTYASWVLDRGIGDMPVRAVIPTAMVLHLGQRAMLERAFGAEVYERYGSEETSIIASECPAHQGMHVAAEGLIVELIAGGRPAEPREEGEIVITDLVNRAMPLIRYRIGDAGVLSPGTCPCGRGLPLLERVSGRVADNIVTPDGRTVSGIAITDHVVEVAGIRRMQIVQEAVDSLVFRIVKDKRFSAESEAALRRHCARIFGEAMRIRCEFVAEIPAGPRGKYRLCVSEVDATTRVAVGRTG
ncbi:MAG: phenylacetate--CoA ligase family protein [Armatimonadota bacterium]